MAAAHVVFVPFLTIIMGIRAAIIGWQVFGKGASAPAGYRAAPSAGWQQSAPAPPSPPAVGVGPSATAPPPPPPAAWAPRSDLGDWSQSMPASPKLHGTAPAPPPPPSDAAGWS
jgi:hypothetical protein